MLKQFQYSILVGVALALVLIGLFTAAPILLATVGAAGIVLLSASAASSAWKQHAPATRLLLGLLPCLAYLMLAGSAVYYLGRVTAISQFFVLAGLPLVAWLIQRRQQETVIAKPEEQTRHLTTGLYAAGLTVVLIGFFLTLTSQSTVDAMRSPWLVASPHLLGWIAAAAGFLFLLARQGRLRFVVIGTSATLFAGLSVALMVFPLGYGFDPFLHQATIEHIALNGTITPKPFYYIGQYALELLITTFSNAPVHAIDVALLPILASLLLPGIVGAAIWQMTRRTQPTAFAMLATLLLPLHSFINTTPQGLANLLTLIILFLALPELVSRYRWTPTWMLGLLALATLAVHPIAGIPTAFFVVLLFLTQRTEETPPALNQFKRLALIPAVLVGAVALPLAFTLFGGVSIDLTLRRLGTLLPPLFFETRFNLIPDLFALITTNGWLWALLLSGAAALLLWRMQSRRWLLYPALTGLLCINALIITLVGDFQFLIDYERTNYTARIISLMLYFLLPLVIVGISLGLERLLKLKRLPVTLSFLLLLSIAGSATVYAAYPRHDAYTISRGYTVSQADHETVASISADAGETPFIVLANQAVSAAAIQDFGFRQYYGEQGDVFYYPVPTGGPLYQQFLTMIEESPTRERALKAMDLADVDLAYFVVNDYWWSADVAIERAKTQTDDWFVIGDGAVWVFVFER